MNDMQYNILYLILKVEKCLNTYLTLVSFILLAIVVVYIITCKRILATLYVHNFLTNNLLKVLSKPFFLFGMVLTDSWKLLQKMLI